MLPRNYLNFGPAWVAATPAAGFAASNVTIPGNLVSFAQGPQKARFLGFVILAEKLTTVSNVQFLIEGHTDSAATTSSAGWTNLSNQAGTTNLYFDIQGATLTALTTNGVIMGSIDLQRSPYSQHRLTLSSVTGSTAWISAQWFTSHKRRLDPQGDQVDYLIDAQHKV